MEIQIVFVTLLFIMLFVLFRAGVSLSKTGKIWSSGGIAAILVYTLNEGLRFGRGIDCVNEMRDYEKFVDGMDSNVFIGFYYLEKIIGRDLGMPFQTIVMLLSFMFILGSLFLLIKYREVIPLALPLFTLVSIFTVENLMKWYLSFSFLMIAMYYQLSYHKKGICPKFVYWSAFSLLFQLAFLPIPIAFYFLYKLDKPLLKPIWSISLFFGLGLFFQTSFMQRFVELVNVLSTLNKRFEQYGGTNAEYWLMKAPGGVDAGAFPGISEMICSCLIVYMGYYVIKKADKRYIYAYNLFLVGYILTPIGNRVELLIRFVEPFYFFRAIVLAYIIKQIYFQKAIRLRPIISFTAMLFFIVWGSGYFRGTFNNNPQKYLYIWDSEGKTSESMIQMYTNDKYEKAKKYRTELQYK